MKRERRKKLDDLLAQGRLSAPQREAMLEEITKAVNAADKSAAHKGWAWLWLPAAVAAGLAALVLYPKTLEPPREQGFRARGDAGATPPILELSCGGVCKLGGLVAFSTAHVSVGGYLAAFAEGPGGERIWYFPDASGVAPRIEAHEDMQTLQTAYRIGGEHGSAAHWRVVLSLWRTPPSRAQASAMIPDEALIVRSEARLSLAQEDAP